MKNKGVPFELREAKWCSRSSIAAKRTSTCKINFSAIRIASRYCPLLTCRSISEMQAALDSSKADRTLPCNMVPSQMPFDLDTKESSAHVQIRYTCCSIFTCLSFNDACDSRCSSSKYAGWSISTPDIKGLFGLRVTTLTFQNCSRTIKLAYIKANNDKKGTLLIM